MNTLNSKTQWLGLAGWLALVSAIAALGGVVSAMSISTWYQTLHKPAWNPPDWIFAPVWTCLYTMMAVAAWQVWLRAGFAGAPWALGMFLLQLAFNLSWPVLFFYLHLPSAGMIDLVVLWLLILVTLVLFLRRSKFAGLLLVPYLLWVGFAGALNWQILILNP